MPCLKPMYSVRGCSRCARAGFPIRRSSDRRLYTASRGFSQCPTSFIGIWRLGIHHKLLLSSLPDTESSIVFTLPYSASSFRMLLGTAYAHYSVVKVRLSCTWFGRLDNTARLTAGLRHSTVLPSSILSCQDFDQQVDFYSLFTDSNDP